MPDFPQHQSHDCESLRDDDMLLPLLLSAAVATPEPTPTSVRPWRDYHAIMWVGDSAPKQPDKFPVFIERLREMGIDTGLVYGQGDPDLWARNNFPFYVENIVNRGLCLKWSSKASDWDRLVTEWVRDGRPETALVRDYCLDDPEWQKWAGGQMGEQALKTRNYRPLAYDIRDELSVTISANPFDYDFGPATLASFRAWLRSQYRNLAELNSEWQTQFTTWEEVKPFTTDQIKQRMATGQAICQGKPNWGEVQAVRFDLQTARRETTRWNFAPWADFRSYMDLSLARALAGIRQAALAVDPQTPVGIEGTQMPHAFGGYDLWRLSQVLDWVEPYDIGNAREIFGSFMPGKPLLTTVFETTTDQARRRLWHLLLEGDRGCIIWWSEDCFDWKSPGFALTPKAQALAPVLKEMRSPVARLFLRAERVRDPIYVHYSQTSIQADWLIESTVDGSTWLRRFSSFEAEHNHQLKVRNAWLKAFQDQGFSPQFLSTEQIEHGALRTDSDLVLVLPSSWAFTDPEASEIASLVDHLPSTAGKTRGVFFDGTPGVFDGHAKLRPASVLEKRCGDFSGSGQRSAAVLRGKAAVVHLGDVANYSADRLKEHSQDSWSAWISGQLGALQPEVRVPAGARVRVHRFRVRGAELLAFERNINYQMSEELKQAGGNEALEKPIEVQATLSKSGHVYDLLKSSYRGETSTLRFILDPWQPALFAVTSRQMPVTNLVSNLTPD